MANLANDPNFDPNDPVSRGRINGDVTVQGSRYYSTSGDPVIDGAGEFMWHETDAFFPGFGLDFQLERTYGSRRSYRGPLGPGWDLSYHQSLTSASSCGGAVYFSDGALNTVRFNPQTQPDGTVVYLPDNGEPLRLWNESTFWYMSDANKVVRLFDENGHLTRISDAAGHFITISWAPRSEVCDSTHPTFHSPVQNACAPVVDDEDHQTDPCANRPVSWFVTQVTDTTNRTIYFNYDSATSPTAKLKCIALGPDPVADCAANQDKLLVAYQYDADDQLIKATDALGHGNSYRYEPHQVRRTYDPTISTPDQTRTCEEACGVNPSCSDNACAGANQVALNQCLGVVGDPVVYSAASGQPKYVLAGPAFDGNPSTQWSNSGLGGAQAGVFQVQLPLPELISSVRIQHGTGQHLQGYSVWISPYECEDLSSYAKLDQVATGLGANIDLEVQTLAFEPAMARCVRIRREGATYTNSLFALAEVQLLAPGGRSLLGTSLASPTVTLSAAEACWAGQLALTPYCSGNAAGSACVSACRDFAQSVDSKKRYGYMSDLNTNMTEVRNADNVLVVSNVYGSDPHVANFDKVIWQHVGPASRTDRVLTWDYYDLSDNAAVGDPAHVQTQSQFSSRRLCPVTGSCTRLWAATSGPSAPRRASFWEARPRRRRRPRRWSFTTCAA
jgi:hypothetical protein